MIQHGDCVWTRKGTTGTIVRRVGETPTPSYLVAMADDTPQIHYVEGLRLNADVEQWVQEANWWNGVERRQGKRRMNERHAPMAGQLLGIERRATDRRMGARRAILARKWD
jgi:hypothetical protein